MGQHRTGGRLGSWVALLTVTILVAGCAGSGPSPSPSRMTAPPPPTVVPTLRRLIPTSAPEAANYPTLTPRASDSAAPRPIETIAPEPSAGSTHDPAETLTATPRPTPDPDLAISSVARAPADPAQAAAAAASINAFGLDLFRKLLADPAVTPDRNAVFSPTSIALALAMARAGAKGETASQMDAVLHTTGWDALGPGLNSLSQALASRDATWQDYATHQLALRIANAAYAQQGWRIEQPYLDAIAAAFGAGLHLADFASDPTGAREAINAWVKEQTNGKIPAFLGPGDIDPSTMLFLINAVYMKAEWQAAGTLFSRSSEPAPFIRPDGSQVEVPTMRATALGLAPFLPYVRGNGWQATELPYQGAGGTAPLAMTLVLPDDLATFEHNLTPAQLERITGALTAQRANPAMVACPDHPDWQCYPYRVVLDLPRFDIETRADLIPALSALGMPSAFSAAADFTGIHAPDSPWISKAIHQAIIDVDEKGTEAAAVTGLGATGGPGNVAVGDLALHFDHPFLFFVRDLETGAVLFMGQVTDPSAT